MNPNNPKQIDISKVKEDVSSLPHYILGERQIAGIRYDPVKKQFYGKTILSVKKFKKSYVEEILPIEWVRENISEKFQKTLIGQTRTKYLWVPIGNSNYGKKYPYTAAGKAAARRAASTTFPTPAVKIIKKGEPKQGGGVKTPMPKKVTAKPTMKPKSPKPKTKSKMTPEDKAYSDLLKKYGNDVTKIPGFKNGKGTI